MFRQEDGRGCVIAAHTGGAGLQPERLTWPTGSTSKLVIGLLDQSIAAFLDRPLDLGVSVLAHGLHGLDGGLAVHDHPIGHEVDDFLLVGRGPFSVADLVEHGAT